MIHDRDIVILGLGGLLAVAGLFLPLPFTGRIVAGFVTLAFFFVLALLRVGADRVPLETYLYRRLRYRLDSRRYAYYQPSAPLPDMPEPAQNPDKVSSPASPKPSPVPLTLAVREIGVFPLVSVFLAVVAVYALVWTAGGGADELANLFRRMP